MPQLVFKNILLYAGRRLLFGQMIQISLHT